MACIVRVPTEVVKQHMQMKRYATTLLALKTIFKEEHLIGFYRGYFNTVAREVILNIKRIFFFISNKAK